jgi:hypothetical protein
MVGRAGVAVALAACWWLVLAACAVGAAEADTRPVAAYSFDEGSGGVASDSAGDHDGSLQGASWVAEGKHGAALDFDGVDDLVSVVDAAALDLTDSFTLEAWVRPDTSNPGPVLTKAESSGGFSGYALSARHNDLPMGHVADSGTIKPVAGTSALPVGEWSHIAFSSDGTTLRLYVNGQLVSTADAIAAKPTAANLVIGRNAITGKWFDGLIDEVRIYDVVLSQGQIAADSGSPVGLNPIPAATYSFDDGSGEVGGDSAGDHDGEIQGPSWVAEGKYGSALAFDGVDDLVSVADGPELDLTDSFTLEAWVRPDTSNPGPVLTKAEISGGFSGYALSARHNDLPMGHVADSGTIKPVAGTSALPVGEWSHIAFSSDGTTLRLYVDGQLVSTADAIAAKPTAANLVIGRNAITGKWFEGLIDEVRIYDQALGQSEIESDRDTPVSLPTKVSGHRDSNAPLVIDPTILAKDPLTTVTQSARVMVIQEMPVTKVIDEVTLGDLGVAGGCSSGTANLNIDEYASGGIDGEGMTRFYSQTGAPISTTPAKLTWSFSPVTLRKGRAYTFSVGTGCWGVKQTTWAHNQSLVNPGSLRCASGPLAKRMWHDQGVDDAVPGCVDRSPAERHFAPSMPTGWLVSKVSQTTYTYWDVATDTTTFDGESPVCYTSYPPNTYEEFGGVPVYWRDLPDPSGAEYVCQWTQFARYGLSAERLPAHGWYYALPWLKERRGAPRDMYLKLDTIDYDGILAEYAPVLKFDSEGEYWNASPQTITDWSENELKFNNQNGACASFSSFVHGTNDWGIETLIAPGFNYPGTWCQTVETDHLDANGDDEAAADSYLEGPLDNKVYGRVVHDSDGALWLQYWLFYYYNTQSVALIGTHQGDWEMVQYRLSSASVPDMATYARHGDGEAERCTWDKVEKDAILVGGVVVREAPVVYVAAASQASYFVAGDHDRGVLPTDHADGQGKLRDTGPGLVSLAGPPAWATWVGQWGEDGSSPRSPARQGTRWDDPKAFNDGAGACSNPDGSLR